MASFVGYLRAFGAKIYGPKDTEIISCSFTTSGGAGAPTVNEACGVKTVVETSPGVFLVTLARGYKHITPVMGVFASTTDRTFVITNRSAANGTVEITQMTAGTNTVVRTLAATVYLVVVGRVNS